MLSSVMKNHQKTFLKFIFNTNILYNLHSSMNKKISSSKVCENCPANISLIIVSSFFTKTKSKIQKKNQQQTIARTKVSQSFARSLTQKKSTVSFSSILLMCIVCCLIYIFIFCVCCSIFFNFISYFLHNRHHSM